MLDLVTGCFLVPFSMLSNIYVFVKSILFSYYFVDSESNALHTDPKCTQRPVLHRLVVVSFEEDAAASGRLGSPCMYTHVYEYLRISLVCLGP